MDWLTDSHHRIWLINVQQVDSDLLHVGAIWVDSGVSTTEIVVLDEARNQIMIELPSEALNAATPLVAYNMDIVIRNV
jgi:hypothetical protein